jgi:uncharacterized OB-fold protein
MSDPERARDAGYDDVLDAIEQDEGYYLECENDHGWLPPRRVCETCGSRSFETRPLPANGTVLAMTTVHVAPPQYEGDTPYVVAIVDFEEIRIAGRVIGDTDGEIARGDAVSPVVAESESAGERLLGFEVRERA